MAGYAADDGRPAWQWRVGGCAKALVRRLVHEEAATPGTVRGSVVFELGSGTGLVALALARLGAAMVMTADLPRALPLAQRNLRANGASEVAQTTAAGAPPSNAAPGAALGRLLGRLLGRMHRLHAPRHLSDVRLGMGLSAPWPNATTMCATSAGWTGLSAAGLSSGSQCTAAEGVTLMCATIARHWPRQGDGQRRRSGLSCSAPLALRAPHPPPPRTRPAS